METPKNEPVEMEDMTSSLSTERKALSRTICDDHLYPSIIKDVDNSIINYNWWSYTAKIFLILKYICLLGSPIISFSAGYFTSELLLLNFLSASLGSLGIGFDRFHNYALNTATENNIILDNILKTLNIKYTKTAIYEDENNNNIK